LHTFLAFIAFVLLLSCIPAVTGSVCLSHGLILP